MDYKRIQYETTPTVASDNRKHKPEHNMTMKQRMMVHMA